MAREAGMYSSIVSAWNRFTVALARLNNQAEVKPRDVNAVMVERDEQDDSSVAYRLKPVVFRIPERKSTSELFVVVRGDLSFEIAAFRNEGKLVTTFFSTQVGYFRRQGQSLTHIFGVHYDFTPDHFSHPAFHAQMTDLSELAPEIFRQYSAVTDLELVSKVAGVHGRVRVPTAQMDVFSVFLQVYADHLVHENSGPEEKTAFKALLGEASFCVGAARSIPRLRAERAAECYRSNHWYPAA